MDYKTKEKLQFTNRKNDKKVGSNSNSKKVVCQNLGHFTSRVKAKKKNENVFHEFFNNVRFWHTPFFNNTLWEKLKQLCIYLQKR